MIKLNSRLKKIFFDIERGILRLKRGKDVLFVIRNELMFNCALPIYKILEKERRIRCWFCYYDLSAFKDIKVLRKKYPLRWISYRWAEAIKWDLIIAPDHGPYFRKDIPKIFSNHGLYVGKLFDGQPYLFGPRSFDEKGKIIYQKIFSSSHHIVEKISKLYPDFSSCLCVVGGFAADKLLNYEDTKRAEDFRRMRFRDDRKTIMLTSTWGPNSMFQTLALDFKKAVESISSSYNVIVSLHFLNYVQRSYEGFKGLIVEDIFRDMPEGIYFIPPQELGSSYLSLADLLVTDHTSQGLYFPVLRRPIIFYNNPVVTYSPYSLIYDLRAAAYSVKNLSNLSGDIQECFKSFDEGKMRSLSEKIFSYLGQSEQRHKEEIFDSLGLKDKGNSQGAVL